MQGNACLSVAGKNQKLSLFFLYTDYTYDGYSINDGYLGHIAFQMEVTLLCILIVCITTCSLCEQHMDLFIWRINEMISEQFNITSLKLEVLNSTKHIKIINISHISIDKILILYQCHSQMDCTPVTLRLCNVNRKFNKTFVAWNIWLLVIYFDILSQKFGGKLIMIILYILYKAQVKICNSAHALVECQQTQVCRNLYILLHEYSQVEGLQFSFRKCLQVHERSYKS